MARQTQVSVVFEPGVDHTLSDELLIRQAAERLEEAEQYLELVIPRRLDEGFSTARVYEAEWQSRGAGESHWSVIKIDEARRLAKEVALSDRFRDAPSFTRVAATSFEDPAAPPEGPGCLFYTHAASLYPGRIESLTDCFRRAVAGDQAAEERARQLLGQTLAVLRKQLHKGDADQPGAGGRQITFYLKRWLPTAVISCRKIELLDANRVLRFFEADHEPEKDVELGRDEDADNKCLGHRVRFEAESLFLTEQKVFVNIADRACFEVVGIEPQRVSELLADHKPSSVRVEGKVLETRRRVYGRRLEALGLDPAAERFELAGRAFRNPLPGLQKRARRWARRHPRPLYSFGHGDLHGGNVLCVGENLAIIDHALAGDDHPSSADAARLIGSLWRTAIAPALAPDEVAEAIDQAFRCPTVTAAGQTGAAARLLKAAVEAAVRSGPRVDEVRRELWIDLHHFAWIALKWNGEPSCHLAMLFLAAVAVEQVESEETALVSQQQLRSVLPDPRHGAAACSTRR